MKAKRCRCGRSSDTATITLHQCAWCLQECCAVCTTQEPDGIHPFDRRCGVCWHPHDPSTWPWTFMTSLVDISLTEHVFVDGRPTARTSILVQWSRVRIVMCSRFGDVGITDNLDATNGYRARVRIGELRTKFANFSNQPVWTR